MTKLSQKFNRSINRFALISLVIVLILSSCTATSYLVVSDTETPIYSTEDSYLSMTTIPPRRAFVYWAGTKRLKTKYGVFNGYSSYLSSWQKIMKLNKKQLKSLEFTDDKGYTYNRVSTPLHGSGSVAGKSSTATSSGGSVHVKGYTRKNGTYVKPHTRSAPRRH